MRTMGKPSARGAKIKADQMRCDKCNERKAQHREFLAGVERNLCCRCYVEEGNPPADWHPECMTTYRAKADAKV